MLEQLEPLARFDQPSRSFLRFAEGYLSNGKSDQAHNSTVSFKNCMLRIPASHNSKCVERNNNGIATGESTEVKIMQKWDKNRPEINLLLGSFYAYLVDQKLMLIKEIEQQQKQRFSRYSSRSTSTTSNSVILWIEKLLQTPIEDHRKVAPSKAHMESLEKNGETRFDEKTMGEVIADHLHYNNGYTSDQIMTLFREKSVFEEDGRDFYELCRLLIMLMVKVHEQGLDYPASQ